MTYIVGYYCHDKYYILLQYMVDANDYFENYFRTFDYIIKRNIRRIREGIDKSRWFEELFPTDINAAYIPNLNQFGMQIITATNMAND